MVFFRASWVPVSTFLIAVALSFVASPMRFALSRQSADPTGGDSCCHFSRIKPVDDFLVEMQGNAFQGIASWQLAFAGTHAGRLAAEGSVRNGYVVTPDINATIRLRLKRKKPESCKHRAHAMGWMEARWSFDVPGTAKTGPFPVNSTGCHLKAHMDSRLESDLVPVADRQEVERRVVVNNQADAGFVVNVSANPGVSIPFDFKLGYSDRDNKDADLERQFWPFDEQCDFKVTSRLEFNIFGNINLTSISATAVADFKVPLGLEDRDEPVYARFAAPAEIPTDFVIKVTCETPEEKVELPLDENFQRRVENAIRAKPKPER